MRTAKRVGVIGWGLVWCGLAALGGCARPTVISEDTTASASSPLQPAGQDLAETVAAPAAPAGPAIDIREIKLIEDNGQQGLFVKLTRPPGALAHYTLDNPPRLVVDINGGGAATAEATAQKYPVENSSLVSEVRVGRHGGQIRLTVQLRGGTVPTYTVNDLNDTVVAFLGEPNGGTKPVHEQIVFTRRAVDVARRNPEAARPATPPTAARAGGGVRSQPLDPRSATASNPADDASQRSRKGYYGQHVSLDLKDADVHNVLRLLADVSKLNIVATDDVQGKVTLRLFDVPWDQALDIVLQVLGLESLQEENVVRISTVKRLREEREELRRAQDAQKAVEPLRVEYIRVDYAKATKLAELINGTTSGSESRSARRTTGSAETENGVLSNRGSVLVDEFSNTLVVRDIQRGIDNAHELVRRLDIQTPQVMIESRIVEATTDFSRELGVQWGYRANIGPQTGTSTGKYFPGILGLGGAGLGGLAGGVPFMVDYPSAATTGGSGTAMNMTFGSIDGAHQLDVRLTAFERDGKARIISRPRVVTLNSVPATIKSLTIIRVKLPGTGTVINTGAGGAAGAQSTATEKIETGIILVVTPQVSSDGFVMLDMFAKSSQADFTNTVDQIPTEISREANSHVLIKDGQTVVLGGIYRDDLTDTKTGTPFLKDIPGIGWLFRGSTKSNRREDLLVFLTPRVLTGAQAQQLPSAEDLWQHRGSADEG